MEVEYFVNRPITPEQFVDLLNQTTLGARRPTDNYECISGMLENADLLVSAWIGERLVGIARSVTDFHYCCYLSDLAVSEQIQSKGIGKELIRQTFVSLKKGCKLILLAAPQATKYYPKIGFKQHNSAWLMSDLEELL
ncbi:GNAT family N-acetyltransferase [Vibrio mimicus]|uniref:GNAT family N-acetyltransferase n=1 Tax=Vibrio TaxID=662 RepID=UPI0001BACA36|nr:MULTISPECIES: GNAT family N-acetyltransferase [Vibrio]EEY36992.1 protein export cytoplasm protein SecA ATPase RNA helicase [Vibrio mimicus MB451]EGQ8122502.1 GNAT family N-acetyltransferase [Vibrio cholerae]EGR2513187.1 GNAT family N-acetyltransferase [Vibrio cholerae]EJL6557070.1 GNAT family N-acetyltransferase [Vibrio cholerae]EJL6739180.1 GNAT family N-acetyltransferase [Vibrio cholerae]